jgi:hypothetical protein
VSTDSRSAWINRVGWVSTHVGTITASWLAVIAIPESPSHFGDDRQRHAFREH